MAPLSHKRPTNLTRFWYGSPYYPEHWDAETRESDPERMQAAGWNCVRMAEFAWDLLEPHEGEFDFSLFDETIHRLGERGISTILCTPTATPPRWLTVRHPDMLRVDASGTAMQHGSRQHTCHNNFFFRAHSRRITRVMAEHFRQNPYVIGWQTDNEINCHFSECHCESCQQAFQDYVREHYHDNINMLNRAWGTAFWALTFGNFEDIETPRENRPTYTNPAQQLDYYRFIAWTAAEFQGEQVQILRDAQPAWFITHNGIMNHVDYRGKFTRDLDFLGYDSYPFFHADPATRSAANIFKLDHARGWSGNFIVPEQQSGPGGQGHYLQDNPEPGEMRRMAYESIASGADSLLFFRWRTCRFGAEEYWCGILDHDNVPRRRYQEAGRLGAELRRVGPAILGTSVHVEAAVAGCELDVYDAHRCQLYGLPSPMEIEAQIHHALLEKGWATGCVHPADNLEGLKLLVIPHWTVFDPAWAANLRRFVEEGGVLVVGARSASKDLNNNVIPATLPGVLRELAGVTVEEFGHQNRPDRRPLWLEVGGTQVQSKDWYEVVRPETARVLGTWQSRHLKGQTAISQNSVGKGSVIYVGTYLNSEMINALLPILEELSGIQPIWPDLPPGVLARLRESDERKVWFFINTNDQAVQIPDSPKGTNLTGDCPAPGGPVFLEAYDVAVIQE